MDTAQFATLHQVDERTVQRWLKDGEVPGAHKDHRGRWVIPPDAIRQTPLPGTDVSPTRRDDVGVVADTSPSRRDMSLAAALDTKPAFLTVDEASTFLGIPAASILKQRDRFGVEPLGDHGRLMVPQRVVRYEAGLSTGRVL